jgi:nicotinamide riboside kinase
LSIVGARIKAEVEAARDGGVVVCDKTVFGALAYLRLFDPAEVPDPLRSAAISFCSSYGARIYDLLVLLDRRFDWTGDPVADTGRYVGSDDQQRYRELVREEVSAAGIAVLPITSAGGAWETSELIVSDLVARELV